MTTKLKFYVILPFALISFAVSLIFFADNCVECPVKIPYDEMVILQCSDRYGVPSSLLKAISWVESMDGKWIWSDSYDVCIRQQWFRDHPDRKKLERKYGHQIGSCVGRWQVLYMSAYDEGFRGSPSELTNISENCKYASIILRRYIDSYGNYKDAIAGYNLGKAKAHWIEGRWDYINQIYVSSVWTKFTNLMVK